MEKGGCLPHGLDGVGEDDRFVQVALQAGVAAMVDNFHLLENRRLQQKGMSGPGLFLSFHPEHR